MHRLTDQLFSIDVGGKEIMLKEYCFGTNCKQGFYLIDSNILIAMGNLYYKPKWEDTITNRMLHWSYTPEQKEEVKKALAAGVPKATILTYFYPEVTVEKMSSYRKKQ